MNQHQNQQLSYFSTPSYGNYSAAQTQIANLFVEHSQIPTGAGSSNSFVFENVGNSSAEVFASGNCVDQEYMAQIVEHKQPTETVVSKNAIVGEVIKKANPSSSLVPSTSSTPTDVTYDLLQRVSTKSLNGEVERGSKIAVNLCAVGKSAVIGGYYELTQVDGKKVSRYGRGHLDFNKKSKGVEFHPGSSPVIQLVVPAVSNQHSNLFYSVQFIIIPAENTGDYALLAANSLTKIVHFRVK